MLGRSRSSLSTVVLCSVVLVVSSALVVLCSLFLLFCSVVLVATTAL